MPHRLDMALAAHNPPADSLIHRSDRGVQYACGDYTQRLQARGVALSMSRVGNPTDTPRPRAS